MCWIMLLLLFSKSDMKISFIEMKNFTPSQGNKQLQRMLLEKKRRITSGQLVFALQSLKKGTIIPYRVVKTFLL